jgi:hypothetical protein
MTYRIKREFPDDTKPIEREVRSLEVAKHELSKLRDLGDGSKYTVIDEHNNPALSLIDMLIVDLNRPSNLAKRESARIQNEEINGSVRPRSKPRNKKHGN